MSNKKAALIFLINAAMFTVLILFHYSGASIKIMNANPLSALALLITVIMFSSELTGVLTGVAVGIVLDSVAATPPGFNTAVLTLISFGAAIISHYLFNRNLKAALTLCLIASAVYFAARWLVGFAFAGDINASLNYLFRYAAPSAIYTAVFAVPFFYLEKRLFFVSGR
ncbi:MAG: rod shape-determining protein MreD [Clostridia bacterium]|nr:rod shape-determining protein MreD [Clostridia bacterium]